MLERIVSIEVLAKSVLVTMVMLMEDLMVMLSVSVLQTMGGARATESLRVMWR